jgi:UDP-glucuronate decarboxylase
MNLPIESSDYLKSIAITIKDEVGDLAGKHLLLTGATGFLGSHIATFLKFLNDNVLPIPCHVTLMDNFISSDRTTVITDSFSFLQYDVCEPFPTFDKPIDFIMHAAGIASPAIYMNHPLEALDVSIVGTRNVLECAKKFGAKVLFFSSSEIYGDPDPQFVPTSETYRGNVSTMGSRACYDEGKRVGETLCHVYHTYFGLHTTIVRPFNVFGPGLRETDRRVMPNFASQLKAGLPVTVYGTGLQTRTYCFIDDAISGFFLTLLRGKSGNAYNIGNPDPEINILDLIVLMEEVIDRKIPLNLIAHPDDYPNDEPMRRCPDISKARTELNFQPTIKLKSGIERFLQWTQANYSDR